MEFEPREVILEKWIAKLLDPETKQAKGYLKTRKGQCCLGVLCEVAGYTESWDEETQTAPDGTEYAKYDGIAFTVLPNALENHMGFFSETGAFGSAGKYGLIYEPVTIDVEGVQISYASLANMNDGKGIGILRDVPILTFQHIAKVIRDHGDKLFRK